MWDRGKERTQKIVIKSTGGGEMEGMM